MTYINKILLSLILLLTISLNSQSVPANMERVYEDVDVKKIAHGMFEHESFDKVNSLTVVNDKEESYYLEQMIHGKFLQDDRSQVIVVLKRPKEELAHAQGFYNAYIAVFDSSTFKRISPVMKITGDEGDIQVFRGIINDFIYVSTAVTYQGWTEWNGGLYQALNDKWNRIWPTQQDFWQNQGAIAGSDRLIILRRKIDKHKYGVIPNSKFVFEKQLIWNFHTHTFEEFRP